MLIARRSRLLHHPVRLALMAAIVALGCSDPAAPRQYMAVHGCERAIVYSVGQTMTGRIGEDDCRGPGGAPADYFALTVNSTGPLRITTRTSDAEAITLYLLVPTGEVVRSASGEATLHVGGTISAAQYIVVVERNRPEGTHGYTLSSAPEYAPVNGCASVRPLPLRTTTTGQLAASDCRHADLNTYMDMFSVDLPLITTLNVTLVPTGSDSVIGGIMFESGSLYDMHTLVRGVDSTFGAGLNRGRYIVFVAGVRSGQTMSYTIRADTAGSYTPPGTRRMR